MNRERQAFVDTILAEPEEESHRLIFADWLEENGNSKEAEKFRTLPGLAGVWSTDWGEDKYGLWCTFKVKTASQRMRWIEPGTFWMSSPEDEEGRYADEGARHQVTLTQGFWLADTPCTQKMWKAVLGKNPSDFHHPQRPVENVDYSDCRAFCEKVSTLIQGLELTLPTEAQWEYACRAGTESVCYHEDLNAILWYGENSEARTQPVGEKLPNAWGLFDILGNVWEWCLDGMREYTGESVVDPIGPTEEVDRILRGGCYMDDEDLVRASCRDTMEPEYNVPFLGFRCSTSK